MLRVGTAVACYDQRSQQPLALCHVAAQLINLLVRRKHGKLRHELASVCIMRNHHANGILQELRKRQQQRASQRTREWQAGCARGCE